MKYCANVKFKNKIGDTFPFLGRKFAKFLNNQNKFHHILTQILIGHDIIKAVFNFLGIFKKLVTI
jgi:hypothetical protein